MGKGKNFWDKEYSKSRRSIGGQRSHLALSTEHAEDLEKFTRFLTRNYGKKFLNVTTKALDVGCGNGRNIIFLSREFGVHGVGYDLSHVAVEEATENAGDLPLEFFVHNLEDPIPLPDNSVTIALDMMSSHVLKKEKREQLKGELHRVLKPGGWLFFKSFLLDEDRNAKRLLEEHPGPEKGMYIHPEINVPEYVWENEDAVTSFFEPEFTTHKTYKSHKHIRRGKAWKRRTISVYLQYSVPTTMQV